jgi:hypothetical protein
MLHTPLPLIDESDEQAFISISKVDRGRRIILVMKLVYDMEILDISLPLKLPKKYLLKIPYHLHESLDFSPIL